MGWDDRDDSIQPKYLGQKRNIHKIFQFYVKCLEPL